MSQTQAPTSVQFRIGPHLYWGRVASVQNGIYEVESSSGTLSVPSQLVVQESEDSSLSEGLQKTQDLSRSLSEALTEPVLRGGVPLRSEGKVSGIDAQRGFLVSESGKYDYFISPAEILRRHPEVGSYLALEWARPYLQAKGLTEGELKPVFESFSALETATYVYMKRGPFRDVALLHAGSMVEVTEYYRGAVTLVADGERFWLPVDTAAFSESIPKDDHYYRTLDRDGDLVPDPLDSLPSQVGLKAGRPASVGPESNWNAQPFLPLVAGNFYAIPDISNDDYGFGLGESYVGALSSHVDEPEGNPETHAGMDPEGEPGLEPTDYDFEIEDGGEDPDHYDAERVESLAEYLVQGASADSIFSSEKPFLSSRVEALKGLLNNPLVSEEDMTWLL